MKIKVIEFNKESHIHTKYLSPGYHLVPIGWAKAKKTVQTPCGENVDQSELSHISGRDTKAATTQEDSLALLFFPSLLKYCWPTALSKLEGNMRHAHSLHADLTHLFSPRWPPAQLAPALLSHHGIVVSFSGDVLFKNSCHTVDL